MKQIPSTVGLLAMLSAFTALGFSVRAYAEDGVCVKYCQDSDDSWSDNDRGYYGNGNDVPSRIGVAINHALVGLFQAPFKILDSLAQPAQAQDQPAGSSFFGQPSTPSGQTFEGRPADRGYTNDTTYGQASSAAYDGRAAQSATTDDSAKFGAGCGFDDLACRRGAASPVVHVDGRAPRGFASVDPRVVSAMLEDGEGKRLIAAESAARRSEAQAKARLDSLDQALGTARPADVPRLSMQRAEAAQAWSNAQANAAAAAVAVENEARKHYYIDTSEQPSGIVRTANR